MNKSVGLFTDLKLYADILDITQRKGYISVQLLEELTQKARDEEEPFLLRVKGLKLIREFKKRTYQDILKELSLFGYIKKDTKYIKQFNISDLGKELLLLYKKNTKGYYDELLAKMNTHYHTPGLFLKNLWELNKDGQGQIVIPTPLKSWNPLSNNWEKKEWNEELAQITERTYNTICSVLPGSLPLDKQEWLKRIQAEYERQGNRIQKRKGKKHEKVETFSPRKRLTLSMKYESIKMLFKEKGVEIDSRTFGVWCSRLEALGLLFYSDYFPEISGRLVFPTSVFRKSDNLHFSKVEQVKNNKGEFLYLHNPKWDDKDFRLRFIKTLYRVYQAIYNKEKIIYVSLQQVRDEVCRLLRINAALFDHFLELSYSESVNKKMPYIIALETDVREDQKSGSQIQRRGVYVKNILHSLIAINN